LLYYDGEESTVIIPFYQFAIKVNEKNADLFDLSIQISEILDELMFEMHKRQSNSQALIKAYHKDLTKVILQFNKKSEIVNQSRHYFPFIE
jgi:hypothetical protein